MKRILYLLIAYAVLSIFCTGRSAGQGVLKVVDMPNFPALPTDSAFESQIYTFDVLVQNTGAGLLQGPVLLFMQVDSSIIVFDTIVNPITGGGTITQVISNFTFNPSLFKTGNNIVVVWPSINSPSITIDTFYTNVFFIPLLSTVEHLGAPGITVYPNPVTDYLYFDMPPGTKSVDFVIYDQLGRMIKTGVLNGDLLDVRSLSRGSYSIILTANKGRDEWFVRVLKE
jgi:type IX secretion system substrate protein